MPAQTFFRTADADVGIGGALIPEGRKIRMFLAAANTDPRRWDRPADFDLDRDPSGHVGFGRASTSASASTSPVWNADEVAEAASASTAPWSQDAFGLIWMAG